jgi:hypothetical protein
LRHQLGLAIADITPDWNDALAGIYERGLEDFITWLGRSGPRIDGSPPDEN